MRKEGKSVKIGGVEARNKYYISDLQQKRQRIHAIDAQSLLLLRVVGSVAAMIAGAFSGMTHYLGDKGYERNAHEIWFCGLSKIYISKNGGYGGVSRSVPLDCLVFMSVHVGLPVSLARAQMPHVDRVRYEAGTKEGFL